MIARSIASCPGSEYVPSLSESSFSGPAARTLRDARCCAPWSRTGRRCPAVFFSVSHPQHTAHPPSAAVRIEAHARAHASRLHPRPSPRCTVTAPSGCPGAISTGAITLRPFTQSRPHRSLELQLGHRRHAHQRGVVPAQVRDLLGQLLQPAHIREAPVVERRIGLNEISNPLGCRLLGAAGAGLPHFGAAAAFGRKRRAIHPAIVQRLAPAVAKSPLIYVFAFATTASYADTCGLSSSDCSTSCALLPPYSGAIIG
jgi:hypothetical protein